MIDLNELSPAEWREMGLPDPCPCDRLGDREGYVECLDCGHCEPTVGPPW